MKLQRDVCCVVLVAAASAQAPVVESSAERVLAALASDRFESRRDAARDGWRVDDPRVRAALSERARTDRHPVVRGLAAESLGRSGDPGAADLLLEIARGGANAFVQEHALIGLGATRDPRAFDVLVKALADPNLGSGAAAGLGEFGDPRAVPIIDSRILAHGPDSRGFAAAAIAALKLDRDGAIAALLARLAAGDVGHTGALTSALRACGPEDRVRDAAEERVVDPRPDVRRVALEVLGACGDLHSVSVLLGRLREEGELRVTVLTALGELRHEFAVDPIARWTTAADADVRLAAVAALSQIAHRTAIEPLRAVLARDEDALVSIRALEGLGRIGDRAALPDVVLRFRDPLDSRQDVRLSWLRPYPHNVFVSDVAWWAARTILDGASPCPVEQLSVLGRDEPLHSTAELAELRRAVTALDPGRDR